MTKEIFNHTIFCDIDGVLLYHDIDFTQTLQNERPSPLAGSRDKLREWHSKGYRIILTTGRPSVYREVTMKHLLNAGMIYDQLVMDCGSGIRHLINDSTMPEYPAKAVAHNVARNTGLTDINI